MSETIAITVRRGMAAASPNLLTPEEAAAIARCSIKTVRRAYATGALTAYRRRGSRAVLLDNQDVLAWAQGQILQPTAPNTRPIEFVPGRPATRKPARRVDQEDAPLSSAVSCASISPQTRCAAGGSKTDRFAR